MRGCVLYRKCNVTQLKSILASFTRDHLLANKASITILTYVVYINFALGIRNNEYHVFGMHVLKSILILAESCTTDLKS